MIKRLIFDFDNTLILWKSEYLNILRNLTKKYNIDCDIERLNYAIGESISYENRGMTIENIIKQAKELCNIDIDEKFVREWIDGLSENTIELEDDIIDTLEYLSKKYNLVILSNFNGETQWRRAKNANIANYFEKCYGSELVEMKPHPNSYKTAVGTYKKDECIMIGDNIKEDIEGALENDLKAIHFDRKGNNEKNDKYQIIYKFSDLKNIL